MVDPINRFFTAIGGVFRIVVRRVEGTGDMCDRIRNVQEREYERFKKMYDLATQSGQGPNWAAVRQKNAHANVTALEQSMRILLDEAKKAQAVGDLALSQFEEDEARAIAPQLAQARGELQAAGQFVTDNTGRSDDLNQQVRSCQEERLQQLHRIVDEEETILGRLRNRSNSISSLPAGLLADVSHPINWAEAISRQRSEYLLILSLSIRWTTHNVDVTREHFNRRLDGTQMQEDLAGSV